MVVSHGWGGSGPPYHEGAKGATMRGWVEGDGSLPNTGVRVGRLAWYGQAGRPAWFGELTDSLYLVTYYLI